MISPFSHSLDKAFCDNETSFKNRENLRMLSEEEMKKTYPPHEKRSQMIVEYILSNNPKIFTRDDIDWIKWLIEPEGNPPYEKFAFLGSILCNIDYSIDIDKMDYLVRDATYLCCRDEIWWDVLSIIQRSRIRNGLWCFDILDAPAIRAISEKRTDFHQRYYCHPSLIPIEIMVQDILLVMDRFIDIRGKLSNPIEFCNLTDDIIENISNYSGPETEFTSLAKKLYKEFIARRPWYQYIGITQREEGGDLPKYVEYHDLMVLSWEDATLSDRYFLNEWKIFVNKQAPHNALPLIPFFDPKDKVENLFLSIPTPPFARVYYHVIKCR